MSVDPTKIRLEGDHRFRLRGTTRHGGIDFDCPVLSQAGENLWWGGYLPGPTGKPPTLPDDFMHLVSLYPWGRYQIDHDLKTELYVQMLDSEDQSLEEIWYLAELVNHCRKTGLVYVHCQAGLNRSSLIVAASLYLNGEIGSGRTILNYLRGRRSPAVLCNPRFAEEVASWG